MDHPVYRLLEREGLLSPRKVHAYVFNSSVRLLELLWGDLYSSISSAGDVREMGFDTSIDAYNFLAGSSIRGDSGCFHWRCRLKKARLLARYAALYCDRVIVPFRLSIGGDELGF